MQIYTDFDKSIGAYKIREVLDRDYGISISVGRVYRLMSTMDLPQMSTAKPKWKGAHKDNGPCNNILNQSFNQQAPNLAWASDFTYIKVNGKDHYLCVVLDLFSRKVIGWHVSAKHDVNLTITTFNKAYENRGYPEYVLFHSDRGSEYTAFTFRRLLDKCNVIQSFSKKGYPFDNACCESFFKQMKREEINRRKYHSLKELYLSCFEYIERYNSKRPHGSLNYLTPNKVEELYWARQK